MLGGSNRRWGAYVWGGVVIGLAAIGLAVHVHSEGSALGGFEGLGIELVSPASLRPGDALPEPEGPVVLTVHVPVANGPERTLRFDMQTLERLGTVRYRSQNRWYPEVVAYAGVLGATFLEYVRPPAESRRMKMRALNDYVVHVPVNDFRRWPVLFATRLNGERMPVREKGPIWVVYPNQLDPELGGALHEDKWIWQLAEIWFEP